MVSASKDTSHHASGSPHGIWDKLGTWGTMTGDVAQQLSVPLGKAYNGETMGDLKVHRNICCIFL